MKELLTQRRAVSLSHRVRPWCAYTYRLRVSRGLALQAEALTGQSVWSIREVHIAVHVSFLAVVAVLAGRVPRGLAAAAAATLASFTQACEAAVAITPSDPLILRVIVAAMDAMLGAVDEAGPHATKSALKDRGMETTAHENLRADIGGIVPNSAEQERVGSAMHGMSGAAADKEPIATASVAQHSKDDMLGALESVTAPDIAGCAHEQTKEIPMHVIPGLAPAHMADDSFGQGQGNHVRHGIPKGWDIDSQRREHLTRVLNHARGILCRSDWSQDVPLLFLL
jgi:hypothetical protein